MNKVYHNANDIEKKILEKKQICYIYYKVKNKYPSVKVYEFYANILKLQKYQEMRWNDQYLGKWFSFVDDTAAGNPTVHEYRAIWADKQRKIMFILSLRYYSRKV
jgi:hypothetical protein